METFPWDGPRVDVSGDKNAIGRVTTWKEDPDPQRYLTLLGPDPWSGTGI